MMTCNIEDYPLIFINSPSSLQNLASTEVALALWRDKYANSCYSYSNLDSFLKQKFNTEGVLVSSVIPSRIRAQIDEKINTIREEMKNWIDFHSVRYLFDGDFREAFSKCIKHIVTDFSSSIGYKATAENILKSREFSDVENYKIACSFCLEDHVSQLWPLVENDERIHKCNHHCGDIWNFTYWNTCMKSGKDSIDDAGLVERKLKVALRWGLDADEAEFKDLLQMLPDNERKSQNILFLWYPRGVPAIGSLPLDRTQVEQLFKEDASAIFKFLLRNNNYFQYAYLMWILMKDLILESASRFYSVINILLNMVYHPDDKDGLNYTRCDQINNLLLEIWSEIPKDLKIHISDVFLSREFIYFWSWKQGEFSSCYGRDMGFFVEFLTFKKSHNEYNRRLWYDNWKELALRTKPLCFDQLMSLCLLNNNDIEMFKNHFRKFDELFRSLIKEGFYSDLNDYLMFCSKDEEEFQQLGEKVIRSNFDAVLLHDEDKFVKFDWFMDQLFPDKQKDAEEFKVQLISSFNSLKNLIEGHHSYKTPSDYFSKAVNQLVANEEKLKLVKCKLLGFCRTYPIDSKRKAYHWLEFVKWCITDDDGTEITASKQSLNIDVVFRIGVSCYLYRKGCDHLQFLDRLLMWYFADNEDTDWRNFKLDKIKNYQQIPLLSSMLWEYCNDQVTDRCYIDNLLIWFYEGDNENLNAFRKNLQPVSLLSRPLCVSPSPGTSKGESKGGSLSWARRFWQAWKKKCL